MQGGLAAPRSWPFKAGPWLAGNKDPGMWAGPACRATQRESFYISWDLGIPGSCLLSPLTLALAPSPSSPWPPAATCEARLPRAPRYLHRAPGPFPLAP